MRSVPEWIGKTDDEAIPPRVKLRIFEKYKRKCCECRLDIVGRLLPAYDHVIAIANGGENKESNIQLLCTECHKVKTKSDVSEKSTLNKKKIKRLKLRRRRTIPGRKFDGTPIPSRWVYR